MAEFTWTPSKGVKRIPQYLVRQTKFGEGYVQLSKDGINNIRGKWSVPFNDRTNTEIKAILDFIDARGGVTPFTWRPPAPWDSADVNVICQDAQTEINRVDENSVVLTFEEFKIP